MTTINQDGTEYKESFGTAFNDGVRYQAANEYEYAMNNPRKHVFFRWLGVAFWTLIGYWMGG